MEEEDARAVGHWLTRALADHLITEAQLQALMRAYRDGAFTAADLPEQPADIVRGVEDDDRGKAVILVILLLGGRKPSPGVPPEPPPLPRPTLSSRVGAAARLSNRAQTVFNARATALAQQVSSGAMSVAEWQRVFGDEVVAHMLEQAYYGAGTTELQAETLARLENAALRQRAYLSRFADDMAVRKLLDEPMSEGYIANRSVLYGGEGRAAFIQESERTLAPGEGYVAEYHARDDERTCSPCHDAEDSGPYLVSDGPFPGSVCSGGGRCRCWREIVYDPQAYARLKGGNP